MKYDKTKEFDFAKMSDAELRQLYSEMEQTAIDLGITKGLSKIPDGAELKDVIETVQNTHNFILVRTTEAKVLNKATKQKKQAAKKPSTPAPAKQKETDTMAKKPASKSKKTPAKKPRAGSFAPTAKITFLAKENPARKGSGAHERVEKVRRFSGKTVEAYTKAGGPEKTLRTCVARKWAKVG